MNRLQASPLPAPVPSASQTLDLDLSGLPLSPEGLFADPFSFVDAECHHEPASATTFMPIHYEAGYAYPLLVWLHGEGQDNQDLPAVMKHVSLRNYVAVAPRGTRNSAESGHQGPTDLGWCDSTESVADTEQRVMAVIALAEDRFNTRSDRVFLAGVGAGGTAALRVGLANPGRFAGVASFDGPMPLGGRPLRSLLRTRSLPLLLAASRQSPQYPQAHVCRDLRLLHTAGCNVNLRQYPGRDDLTTAMLSDLDCWMMDIVCGG